MDILPSLVLLVLLSQQGAPQATFRTGVNLVEVDVVVLDRTGQPVRGLRQEDFEVFEDGKPVPISAFIAVDLPPASPESAIPPPDRSGSSLAANDQPDDGRVMLIVMDDYHVRFDAGLADRAKKVARRLVERLGPSDQAAVIATSGRNIMQAEFTGDKARLIEAIDRFFPQSERPASASGVDDMFGRRNPTGGNMGFVGEIKARWAMETLSNAARALAQIPHRRKAMLLVSEGLPASVEEIITSQHASGAFQALREFVLTAQRSNVAVYAVDPCGLSLDCSTDAQQNLRSLAESTGGFAVVNTNAPEESVERIIAENGTYYLLGYASPSSPNDGRRHRIQVRTRVPDVQIRAREGYVSPREATRPTAAPRPLDALIGAPIQTRGLTLRVAAVPAPGASRPGATIVVAIEVKAADAVEAGTIEFSLAAVDTNGKVRASQRFSNTFKAMVAAPSGWARLQSHVAAAPGRYQLRIAAVGANNSQGSVFTEVTVPKFDAALAVGGLALVAPAPGAAADARHMAEVLPLAPLTIREVPANRSLAAHVPVRVGAKSSSGPLRVTAALVRPDGDTVQLESATRDAAEFATPSGQIYRVALPPSLASGAYRLVLEFGLGRARVTRELAFDVVAAQ